jgi:hypothetical protein
MTRACAEELLQEAEGLLAETVAAPPRQQKAEG